MSEDFIVHAETRTVQGTGASRRLRRSGRVPAILYGGASEPVQLSIDHNEMLRHLEHEAFYSHILSIDVDGKTENAVLKDLQRHPAKAQILHADFMRVVAGQAMRMTVPLHFVGEDTSPGIKNSGGVLDRQRNELEIECLPKNLPEYIEVDVSALDINDSIHLEELTLPEGVESVAKMHGENWTVAAVHVPRVAVEESDEDAETDAEGGEAADGEGESED
ncbi:50S ribosomal protein L25/general stress protein Ctc [Abyssibacter sp.]|jgi:large subunit ribosomal protein L25|uniref:50S ribosomal protein L25/general stress protein Ctc n=1 Tax=Abyssibacter sp. TaxID=2320200 RepID=UPI0025BC7DD4|nr:50S ribosomal protein L25/general stress protein Ctc [Abyssibacter sp.]MCK5860438.1 50S ribosomal protein L25/general stress protein Ctc [Abyssibacter sp.]